MLVEEKEGRIRKDVVGKERTSGEGREAENRRRREEDAEGKESYVGEEFRNLSVDREKMSVRERGKRKHSDEKRGRRERKRKRDTAEER